MTFLHDLLSLSRQVIGNKPQPLPVQSFTVLLCNYVVVLTNNIRTDILVL